ncbi:isocitrate dehydrogenase (NAD(+)) idh1, partial [Spiromyces aspiralis]
DLAGPKVYGGNHTVTLIPGDGIGQETADSVKAIFKEARVPVTWEQFDVSGFTTGEDNLMKQALESLRRNKVGLKGILYTPVRQGHSSFNVAMRKELDIYASVATCKNIEGLESRHTGVDITIIRENTEGEYSGLEHQSFPGVVESLKIITRAKTERIARYAFDYALRNNRKKVTCVHKANIMKLADGLFLETCRRISQEYKETGIEFNDMIVDNTAMQMVNRPQQFDVMVMPNLYGSIVSNIGAGLIGGPGIGSRHVGKDIQGRNTANPTALILSSVSMLRHLMLDNYADMIENAVRKTIAEGTVRTPDMGGSNTTTDFTEAVMKNL